MDQKELELQNAHLLMENKQLREEIIDLHKSIDDFKKELVNMKKIKGLKLEPGIINHCLDLLTENIRR